MKIAKTEQLKTSEETAILMSKIASNLPSQSTVSFNKNEIEKIASLLKESSQAIKTASTIAKELLSDNEELSNELNTLKKNAHDEKRQKQIDKIASILSNNGLISNSAMPEKIAELKNMSDTFLTEFENTISGLNNSSSLVEKEATEGTISTFAFLDGSLSKQAEEKQKTFEHAFDN